MTVTSLHRKLCCISCDPVHLVLTLEISIYFNSCSNLWELNIIFFDFYLPSDVLTLDLTYSSIYKVYFTLWLLSSCRKQAHTLVALKEDFRT